MSILYQIMEKYLIILFESINDNESQMNCKIMGRIYDDL